MMSPSMVVPLESWRMRITAALVVCATACPQLLPADDRADVGASEQADAGPHDSAAMPEDTGASVMVDSGVSFAQPNVRLSSGGGVAESNNYRLQLTVGGSTPSGSASSPGYRLSIGANPTDD